MQKVAQFVRSHLSSQSSTKPPGQRNNPNNNRFGGTYWKKPDYKPKVNMVDDDIALDDENQCNLGEEVDTTETLAVNHINSTVEDTMWDVAPGQGFY